ncbi:hypothetical protein [Parvularcula marina]|uniref:hypothetical protein n=1 Tax=Parvularcula marina TaxID=2292771 RepID=UPI0035130EA0
MKRPLILGSAVIGLTLPVHFLVPEPLSVQIAAITLALIAGAYIGFAAADGSLKALIVELAGASVFGLAALAGLVWNPLAIPLGIMVHGLWDFAHHNNRFGASIPQWYIPFCVWIDFAVGGVLLALYLL